MKRKKSSFKKSQCLAQSGIKILFTIKFEINGTLAYFLACYTYNVNVPNNINNLNKHVRNVYLFKV